MSTLIFFVHIVQEIPASQCSEALEYINSHFISLSPIKGTNQYHYRHKPEVKLLKLTITFKRKKTYGSTEMKLNLFSVCLLLKMNDGSICPFFS